MPRTTDLEDCRDRRLRPIPRRRPPGRRAARHRDGRRAGQQRRRLRLARPARARRGRAGGGRGGLRPARARARGRRRAHQRPKLEDYDGSYFVVLKTARYDDEREEVDFGEINLFLGSGYAIAVRHGDASALNAGAAPPRGPPGPDRGRARPPPPGRSSTRSSTTTSRSPPGIDNDIAEVEDEVFAGRGDPTERIYFLRREVIEFHRAVQPLIGRSSRSRAGSSSTSTSRSSATSATSPTTPAGSTSSSTRSATCSPASSRRTWR